MVEHQEVSGWPSMGIGALSSLVLGGLEASKRNGPWNSQWICGLGTGIRPRVRVG